MVNFTINLEVTIRVGTQRNETFISWHEIQNRALKYITFLIKLVISHQPATLSKVMMFNIHKLC